MRRVSAIAAIVALTLAAAASTGVAAALPGPPTMPVSAVRAGMTGYGLTVLHGTAIERFEVKILGILHGGPTDLVLFRAGGPAIREAGGNAAGMSGSPIYVGGRMLGALSYGYQFPGPDADLSLATPIDAMLKVLGPGAAAASTGGRIFDADRPIPTRTGRISRVVVMDSAADAAAYNAHPLPGVAAFAPAAVSLFASGVTPDALTILTRALSRFNVAPRQQPTGTASFAAPPLQPGSALGVELVRGDTEVGGIGTVTYRRGNEILAFGHPMLNAGSASVMMTTAYIDAIVRALDEPFKEGSIGSLVGTITQDRGVGIAGTVGQYPRTFDVRVQVRDADTGETQSYGAQVVRRPDLAEALVPTTALSLIQRAMDRVAGGSATVKITLRARDLPDPIVRQDLAYDIGDIATASALDVPGATQLLFGNFFRSIDPIDMTIDITVASRPNTAVLVTAHPSSRDVHPGDTMRVAVGVRPYGGSQDLTRVVQFTVPQDFPPGPAFLLVGTAGTINNGTGASAAEVFQTLVGQQGTPIGVASLEEAVAQFEDAGKNTDVLVELVPDAVLTAVGSNANPDVESPAGTVVPSQWVVLGKFQIPVTVR